MQECICLLFIKICQGKVMHFKKHCNSALKNQTCKHSLTAIEKEHFLKFLNLKLIFNKWIV